MPIPTPKKAEKQQDYMGRCMGDATMMSEYPDQKQRAAICYSKHREHMKQAGETHSETLTVDSLEGVTQVELVPVNEEKGVTASKTPDGRIIQYHFDLLNEAGWTPETMAAFIEARGKSPVVQSVLDGALTEMVNQASYLPDEIMAKLKTVDPEPFFVPVHITYGLGSRKQYFDKAFFDKAGPKFEGQPFTINHSDLSEFGKAIPIGSIVKYAGSDTSRATFIAYVSGSEGTLRQKIRESQALGDKGFVKKVSIEGMPGPNDYVVEKETGIKRFSDLAMPTGIAIVIKEGLKGSQIGG